MSPTNVTGVSPPRPNLLGERLGKLFGTKTTTNVVGGASMDASSFSSFNSSCNQTVIMADSGIVATGEKNQAIVADHERSNNHRSGITVTSTTTITRFPPSPIEDSHDAHAVSPIMNEGDIVASPGCNTPPGSTEQSQSSSASSSDPPQCSTHEAEPRKLMMTKEVLAACAAMRGPQYVNHPDPILTIVQAEMDGRDGKSDETASKSSSAGYRISSLEDASFVSSETTFLFDPPPRRNGHFLHGMGLTGPLVTLRHTRVDHDPWKFGGSEAGLGKMSDGDGVAATVPPGPQPSATPGAGTVRDESETDANSDDVGVDLISPSDFLALAEGCHRWATDDLKADVRNQQQQQHGGVGSEPRRMRPDSSQGTPKFGHHTARQASADEFKIVRQWDQEDGTELSPCYKVPSSPSVIWTPPGVSPRMVSRYFPHGEFDRMDPAAAQAFREARFGPIPYFGTTGAADDLADETFTNSQVGRALAEHRGPIFDDITPSLYHHAIDTVQSSTELSRAEESRLERFNDVDRGVIRALEREVDDHLEEQHKQQEQQQQHDDDGHGHGHGQQQPGRLRQLGREEERHGRNRCLRHMASRLRENIWQHECAEEALCAARRERAELRRQLARLEARVAELAVLAEGGGGGGRVGKRTVSPSRWSGCHGALESPWEGL